MKKKMRDGKAEPPRRMATRSQTRATAEDQSSLELCSITQCSTIDRRIEPMCARSHSCLRSSAHVALCYFLCFKLLNLRYFTYLISIRVLRVLTDIFYLFD
jgi:hypothetical protein